MLISYTTDRLSLNLLQPAQADMVLNFYKKNQEFLQKYEPFHNNSFYTYNYHHANLTYEYNAFFKSRYFRFWIFKKENSLIPIGTICFSNFLRGAFCSCMVGYKLDRDYCHNGYMYEALAFLLPIIGAECKIHRIEAMVMPDNAASINLLEHLNFIREGYLKSYAQINGKWQDHYLYTYIHNLDVNTTF